MNNQATELIRAIRVVPVIRIDSEDHVVDLIAALSDGGLPIAEITLRTDCALSAIEKAASQFRNAAIGAGTVLNAAQAQDAVRAGARFIVSPGLDEGVVRFCRANEVPVFPGVSSATEIQKAFNLEVKVTKFFPAEAMGGLATLKALAGPFHDMQFVPTGGISPANMIDYLQFPATLAVGGSWMAAPNLYRDGDFTEVRRLAEEAVKLADSSGF